jgi:hypothetical protein
MLLPVQRNRKQVWRRYDESKKTPHHHSGSLLRPWFSIFIYIYKLPAEASPPAVLKKWHERKILINDNELSIL